MSEDEDIQRRRAQLAVLEATDDKPFRNEYNDETIYGEDDLEQAARISAESQMQQGQEPGDFSAGQNLDAKVTIRQAKWNDLVKYAPFARNNPPSVLHGTLGGQQTVYSQTDPDKVPATLQVANWGGEDAETTPITVTFAPVQQAVAGNAATNYAGDPPQIAFGVRPFGIIQFGTRGFLPRAEVDIGLGTQFTVSGSSVTLQVGLDLTRDTFNVPIASNMQLAGMLSFHPVIRTTPVTRTRYFDGLVSGAEAFTTVPPFAKQVTLWTTNQAAAPIAMAFYDSAGILRYNYFLTPPYDNQVFDLAGDITSVGVAQTSGSNQNMRLIFRLEF